MGIPMDTKADSGLNHTPAEVSFVRGGPFYRAQQALGLIHPNKWNLGRRAAVVIVITWLPLIVLAALLNLQGLNSLLRDYRVHARLLIALPVLLFGELLMEARFRAVMSHIRQAHLLDASELEYMDGVVATLVSLRDSFLPELAVLLLLVIHTALTYKAWWITRHGL